MVRLKPIFENLGNDKVKESNFIKKKKNSRVNVYKNTWRVDTYLSSFFSINIARSTKHYDKELIQKYSHKTMLMHLFLNWPLLSHSWV